jgi:hypothetical protein
MAASLFLSFFSLYIWLRFVHISLQGGGEGWSQYQLFSSVPVIHEGKRVTLFSLTLGNKINRKSGNHFECRLFIDQIFKLVLVLQHCLLT